MATATRLSYIKPGSKEYDRYICCHGNRTPNTPYEDAIKCYGCGGIYHRGCWEHYVGNKQHCPDAGAGTYKLKLPVGVEIFQHPWEKEIKTNPLTWWDKVRNFLGVGK